MQLWEMPRGHISFRGKKGSGIAVIVPVPEITWLRVSRVRSLVKYENCRFHQLLLAPWVSVKKQRSFGEASLVLICY